MPELYISRRSAKGAHGQELVILPDYVFIDINMPGITGDMIINVLRRLEKQKEFDKIIITLYSTSMPHTVAEALKIDGANFVF